MMSKYFSKIIIFRILELNEVDLLNDLMIKRSDDLVAIDKAVININTIIKTCDDQVN